MADREEGMGTATFRIRPVGPGAAPGRAMFHSFCVQSGTAQIGFLFAAPSGEGVNSCRRGPLMTACDAHPTRRHSGLNWLGRTLPGVLLLGGAILAGAGPALALDCARAQAPVEKLICASPGLQQQDNALGALYGRLIAAVRQRDPADAVGLRDAQRRWIASRDSECLRPGAAESAAAACLAGAYARRLAELRAVEAGMAAGPAAGAEAAARGPAAPPRSDPAAAPASPAPAPKVVEPAAPPAPSRPVAAARFAADDVPAAGEGQALLEVETAGRFAIRVESKTGVALQLVDMIAGPIGAGGEAGARDGRIDALLDKGVYKIRSFGAKDAPGAAKLSATPFREVPGTAALGEGAAAELGDFEQRSYSLAVGKSGRVSVEAIGRALGDLRLWRDGSELAGLAPAFTAAEVKPGHPMTRARLEGAVEPGTYLVTVYGGEAARWTDGDKTNPFRIRKSRTRSAAGGAAEGVIGPFGVERFELPASANHLRLELPDPAAATLSARRGASAPSAFLTKSHREPVADVELPSDDKERGEAEVSGFEGQSFRLRALRSATTARVDAEGPHLFSADVAGEGGDELPATVVLARFAAGKTTGTAIASSAPRLGQGQAWRRRFNLRGPSSLVFEMTAAGPVAIRTAGPAVTAVIEPVLGYDAPRADGATPGQYELDPGWYALKITPVNNAVGVLDLTFGQPGLTPEAKAPAAPRTAIALGTHTVAKGDYLLAVTGSSPALVIGPRAVALPADLGAGPAVVFQAASDRPAAPPAPAPAPNRGQPGAPGKPGTPAPAGQPSAAPPAAPAAAAMDIPLRVPLGGAVTAADAKGAAVPIVFLGEKADQGSRLLTVRIPAAAASRTVVLSWSESRSADDAAPPPAPAETPRQTLAAGTPAWFDLIRDGRRSFRLEAEKGGLYRVETLGRLKTGLEIATPFLPQLANADNNGPGHNALVQTYLRAGSYRVRVKASDSAGRLGLLAAPAVLAETATLRADGAVRATLAEGRGASIPLDVAQEGDYRLDVYGLGRDFTVRLEDAEGWPLAAPAPLSSEERRFKPGRYRLVALPQPVEARLVARLRRKTEEKPTEGHGPHPLAFDRTQNHQWREPAARDALREPDRWTFALDGEAHVALDISEGMTGELIREAAGAGAGEQVARIAHKKDFSGRLEAGRYRLEARSLGRNDRLDYRLTLRSTELQPGAPRLVRAPASLPFAIAEDRVVSLTTFGRVDLNAVLKDASGRVVERLSGRTDDWNVGLSRRLPAGAWRLELAKAGSGQDSESSDGSESEGGGEGEGDAASGSADKAVEVRLALPEPGDGPALAAGRTERFAASGVRQFPVPPAEEGALTIAAAESSAELVLSLEREENGRWIAQGFERGRAPVLAWPGAGKSGAGSGARRISVWTVDGDAAPVALAVQTVATQPQPPGAIVLKPVTFDGVGTKLRAALVAAPGGGLVTLAGGPSLSGESSGLSEGSAAGRPLRPASAGVIVPQSDRLWLLSRSELETVSVTATPAAGSIPLALGEGETAILPASAGGESRVWLAESRFGQPGLDAGAGMGVARDSVLASAAPDAPLRVWNASGREALRLRISAIGVRTLEGEASEVDGQFTATLPPRSRRIVALSGRGGQATVDLAPGTAAFAGTGETRISVWAGREAVSRAFGPVAGTVALVNAGDRPAPVRLTVAPAGGEAARLAPGQAFRRFFGAAGSLSLPVEAEKGDRLVVAGGDALFIGRDGSVTRGRRIELSGPGEVVLDHGAGLLAAWLERAGQSPWPVVRAATAKLPSVETLKGEAMAFAVTAGTPLLLHARSTAPVILALRQGEGEEEEPELYPAGAEFHRHVAPGKAELRVYSPHDGPLSGALELSSAPVAPAAEGVGDPVALAAGGTALFGFEVTKAGPVGVGVRSEPDTAQARLLDARGKAIGEGVSLFRRLEPGRYVIEARVPASGGTVVVRPTVVGVAPPPAGPPPEVVENYLDMAGLKSARGR